MKRGAQLACACPSLPALPRRWPAGPHACAPRACLSSPAWPLPCVLELLDGGRTVWQGEINSASMAVDELKDYLEHGIVRNSVNFPKVDLPRLQVRG